MQIPIILINRDRLQYTEHLVDQLLMLGYGNITILDMSSEYRPLLDWYTSRFDLQVLYHKNSGHKALWNDGILAKYFSQYPWVAISDSDIRLNDQTPKGFIEDMITVAKDFRMDKCGLSINYKDISNPFLKEIIYPIESKYWTNKLKHNHYEVYLAPVDTTFCVIRPALPFTYHSLRVADWPINHMDWYSDWSNLTEEEHYYFQHADQKVATTKTHYLNWKMQNETTGTNHI